MLLQEVGGLPKHVIGLRLVTLTALHFFILRILILLDGRVMKALSNDVLAKFLPRLLLQSFHVNDPRNVDGALVNSHLVQSVG